MITRLDIFPTSNTIHLWRGQAGHIYKLTPKRVIAIARAARHTNRFDLISAQNDRRKAERAGN